jgi:hypothetical protein
MACVVALLTVLNADLTSETPFASIDVCGPPAGFSVPGVDAAAAAEAAPAATGAMPGILAVPAGDVAVTGAIAPGAPGTITAGVLAEFFVPFTAIGADAGIFPTVAVGAFTVIPGNLGVGSAGTTEAAAGF